jgi:putative endonuclease
MASLVSSPRRDKTKTARSARKKLCSRAKGDLGLMHYLYVVRSVSDDWFYIGYTWNLRTRLRQHSEGNSFATSHRGPWKLIYYEAYREQANALGREKYLKSGAGRGFPKLN